MGNFFFCCYGTFFGRGEVSNFVSGFGLAFVCKFDTVSKISCKWPRGTGTQWFYPILSQFAPCLYIQNVICLQEAFSISTRSEIQICHEYRMCLYTKDPPVNSEYARTHHSKNLALPLVLWASIASWRRFPGTVDIKRTSFDCFYYIKVKKGQNKQ